MTIKINAAHEIGTRLMMASKNGRRRDPYGHVPTRSRYVKTMWRRAGRPVPLRVWARVMSYWDPKVREWLTGVAEPSTRARTKAQAFGMLYGAGPGRLLVDDPHAVMPAASQDQVDALLHVWRHAAGLQS